MSPAGREALDGVKRPVVEPVPAVGRLAVRRHPQPVAGGQADRLGPVRLEAGRLVERQRPVAHEQTLPVLEALGVLVELEHVAGVVAGRLSPLRFRQVQRPPGRELPLLAELALRRQLAADDRGDALALPRASATPPGRSSANRPASFPPRLAGRPPPAAGSARRPAPPGPSPAGPARRSPRTTLSSDSSRTAFL